MDNIVNSSVTLTLCIYENFAVLSKDENMDHQFWNTNVKSWWSDVAVEATENELKIPLEVFLVRRGWFRSNWGPLGGRLTVDEATKTYLSDGIEEFEEFRRRVENSHAIDADISLEYYKRSLTSHQIHNVQHLIPMRSGANFSVPGAGKTSTTLVLWHELRLRNRVDCLLVVCPRSAFESWEVDIESTFEQVVNFSVLTESFVDTDVEVLAVNYEKLESDTYLNAILSWTKSRRVHLVLDEAHRIKGGANSVRWRRCKTLSSVASRVDLLTGTPMPQGYDDLRNLFAVSWPNVPRSYITDDRLGNLARGGLFVRTTKSQMNLPPVSIHQHRLQMSPIQADIYSALRKKYAGVFKLSENDESYFGSKGRAVMSLLAAASNPGLLAGITREDAYIGLEWPPRDVRADDSLLGLVESYATHEMPAKYKWIAEFVENSSRQGKKVLVWSNLVGNLLSLARLLKPKNPALIYGAVDDQERKAQLKKFRTDETCSVLITNPQTLGEGVSLHKECHDAVYLDRSYNAGHYLQSLDRIHRLGLPADQLTNIHILCSENSIDERVSVRLEQKIDRLARSLNDTGLTTCSLPDDSLTVPTELFGIDKQDLDDLFSHLANEDHQP